MKSARLHGHIDFDGDSFQIVAQKGARLALKSQTTNRIRHVALVDLLGDDSYEPHEQETAPSLEDLAVLERLDPDTRRHTEWLAGHITDIIDGNRRSESGDDAEVSSKSNRGPTLADRIDAKAQELATTDTPIAPRTLRKYVTNYRQCGLVGLVDGRKTRVRPPGGFQDMRLLTLIEAVLDEQTDKSTGTMSRVVTIVSSRATQIGVPVPSRSTMYRIISESARDRHSFGPATTRRSNARRPKRTYGRRTPMRPGELVEIDSTKLDLMVVYPDGTTGRPELTTMIDLATRTLCAAVLFPEATTGIDVAAHVLARSLAPLSMQPGWGQEVALSRSVLPAGMIEPDATLHDHIAARPLIYPETITIDRGKVFTGSVFQMACERLQISVIPAPPATPTAKLHIERQSGSVHDGFVQYLHGFVGRDVARRGVDPARDAIWTLQQVQSLLDQWIVLDWQNRPRKALVIPGMPKKALTPNEMYTALSTISPTPPVALTRQDYIALLPMEWRTVQQYGINLGGLHYDCDEIHAFRGQRSGIRGKANDRWEVRYDPGRMQVVYFRDHIEGQWIEGPWTLADRVLAPFSKAVLGAALRVTRQKTGPFSGAKVIEEILRIQSGIDVSATERRAARRRSGTTVPELEVVEDRGLAKEPAVPRPKK